MAVKTLRRAQLKSLSGKRRKKRLSLTPETKKEIRKHMPARYKLMAEIIEDARGRRAESLRILGVINDDVRGIHATCPDCGHRFRLKSPAKADS